MNQANVGNMNDFYQRQYSTEDLQALADINNHDRIMDAINSSEMHASGLMGNQTLDDILNQNNKELNRRRSFHQSSSYGAPNRMMQEQDPRRSSMMEFGSGSNSDLEGFQFDPAPAQSNTGMQRQGNIAQRRLDSQRARRQMSDENLGLNTNFSSMPSNYTPMSSASPYGQSLNPGEALGYNMPSNFLANNMLMNMDFSPPDMENVNNGAVTPRNTYGHNNFTTSVTSPPISHGMSASIPGQMRDPGGGNAGSLATHDNMEKMPDMQLSDQITAIQMQNDRTQSQATVPPPSTSSAQQLPGPLPEFTNSQRPQPTPNLDITTNTNGLPYQGQVNAGQQVIPQYRNAYSSSGFDMLGVLMRVAARPKPQINIGAVDMSCAFVVCDVTQHDIPIVYCSDVFERLTAYTKYEILGRNCRFLQSPDGKIEAGVKRKYVDDQSVLRIKNMINERQETQISLINYRKGGQPFMNLLTMIPIAWDTDEIKYYVGFQVDLVEQPASITNKNPDGTYLINYQRSGLPAYMIPEHHRSRDSELGQTIARDDVSTVLTTFGSGESDLSKRIWDKVLLENTDDVVHVLSLKGLFLYLSPSSRKVLEYDPSELVGTALSSVCHPSDIVPVTRELKDTSTGAAVNVVFRIRRKQSGYTWFESHGSLHLEQGKGRKCIIMVGRERPVYALARQDIDSVGGFGESELWTKMSTSGMYLFVSSNVRSLLDRQPEDLVGTSAQALMRKESQAEFGKKLELARTGVRATFKHDVQNKRGQTLQAKTTIYPGDAQEGQKPTFLVAQTRLLKPPRGQMNRQSSNISPKIEQNSTSPVLSLGGVSGIGQTPASKTGNANADRGGLTTQAGGSGLVIGNQHEALASEENVFDELKTTRSTSWQFELRQMEKRNRLLAEELQSLLSSKKKRKRRNGAGLAQKDCANCHTRVTPEWRRGPSGNRDLCNSCGLRWAKENGRVTPRTSSQKSDKESASSARSNSLNSVSGLENIACGETSPSMTNLLQQQRSPQALNADSHHAKMARMEAAASEGFGGGIPAKIEEGVEPGDNGLSRAPC